MIDAADRAHQTERERLAEATTAAVLRVWTDEVDAGNVRASWAAQVARVAALLTAGQLRAAEQSDPWLRDSLGLMPVRPLVPSAFAGTASDGRTLMGLLASPLWAVLTALANGRPIGEAMTTGANLLGLLVRTQVADAGRAADSVAMTAQPRVAGYERVVSLPACGRCLILAGRLYRWSTGFARHPRCDCTMSPVTDQQWREDNPTNTPAALFAQMSPEAQAKAFTQAGAEAIRDGANPTQVINARRGMTTATAYGQTLQATTEGTTRRGLYGGYRLGDAGEIVARRTNAERERRPGSRYSRARAPRLMPAEIYQRSDDRDHAVRLLGQYGYLT